MANRRSTTNRDPGKLGESDFASERMGYNRLQADDQTNVRNERQSMPEENPSPDGMEESFRKLDKDVRARTDLNKGARTPKD